MPVGNLYPPADAGGNRIPCRPHRAAISRHDGPSGRVTAPPRVVAMMLAELVETLRAEGIDARPHRIHHAIQVGHLARPRVVSGRFVFGRRDLAAARAYLRNVPRPGRKPGTTVKER